MKRHIILVLLSLISLAGSAQEKIGSNLEIDKNIHDFGDVLIENVLGTGANVVTTRNVKI